MTRINIAIATLSLAALIQATPAAAQGRWGIELRANGAVATQDELRDTHQNGFGFEAAVQYRFLPHLGAYVGWDWHRFSALDAIAGPDMDLEETGYAFGLRFEHPFREGTPTAGWVRVGGSYDHLELENADGDLVDDSGHGLGWEAAAGVAVELNGRWSLTPGIRYRALSRDIELDGVTTPVELQYVAFEVGLRRSL